MPSSPSAIVASPNALTLPSALVDNLRSTVIDSVFISTPTSRKLAINRGRTKINTFDFYRDTTPGRSSVPQCGEHIERRDIPANQGCDSEAL